MKYSLEKTIAAAMEPVIEAIVALEKKVEALQQARDAEAASQPKRAARTRAPRTTPVGASH